IAIAPGREDLQLLLAQTQLRANRTAEARELLESVSRSTSDPEIRRRATALLDQSEKTATITEITSNVEKELANEKAEEARRQPTPTTPPAPPAGRAQDTVLEALTPIGPAVEGEKVSGLLTNMDCSNGLKLTIRTDRSTVELHSSEPKKIQFISYTTTVSNNIRCGAINPNVPVTVTYQPVPVGLGEPLLIEFQERNSDRNT